MTMSSENVDASAIVETATIGPPDFMDGSELLIIVIE
jgi:hypothetical protein